LENRHNKEALATLKYGILDNKGFLLLTGDVGTGKTSLINSLIQSLGEDIICTSVPDPSLEKWIFSIILPQHLALTGSFPLEEAFWSISSIF
jgi:general secretion pathway protein A